MGRPLRIEYAGGKYHVINRGNYRQDIFSGKGAAEAFERVLDEAARRYDWRIHAYVIMRNHFHLAVELTEPNLSEGMKWLQGTWIRRFNRFRGWIGRPFQGRYKALLAEPGGVFAKVCNYVHLNPVRAGIVRPDKAADYRWSSLPRFLMGNRPPWLESSTVLCSAGDLPDTPAGWRQYAAYLEFIASDRVAGREMTAKHLSCGWCLGGSEFKAQVRATIQNEDVDFGRKRFSGLERDELRRERELVWKERLQVLARRAGIALQALPEKKSHPGKLLIAAAMKSLTSVSNAWLAQALELGSPESVSQFLYRWRQQSGSQQALKQLLSNVQT